MALGPGTRLGAYEIVTLLGSGGMGEVYRARDTKLARDVALKILPNTFTHDPDRLARFRREAQVLASLNHPHIGAIYGLDDANGIQFLVLELVDGESLHRRIARGPIPVDEALGVAKQIAEALEAAHEKGIIHRDLKPANIALTKDGNVKVLDFGLAKPTEAAGATSLDLANSPTITSPAMMTGVGMILGTAAYMSPEQAKGRPADRRSDVWAFGCVLYEMRGRNCILACYNGVIPALVPELPARQREALEYGVKVPMMYNNVLVRRWTAFQKLGVTNINAPGMYHTSTSLDPGTTLGGYRGVTTPEEPIIVRMVRNPNQPGLPRREQHRAGQRELLSMTFEQFELEIRRQLGRMLAGGGFDPASDIVGITVNRWPYGYAYTYDTIGDPDVPQEERPHVIGRQRFGRITIANADAGAAAFTNQAIDEAHRAVEELFVREGLT